MRYLFDGFEINEAQRRLSKDGVEIPTEPKVFDVLIYLTENRHRSVPREELLEKCWPGVYVGDGTLSRCLSRVRQALGQARSDDTPIQTLHSRGYRFVAELTIGQDGEAPEAVEESGEPAKAAVERRFLSLVHIVVHDNAEEPEVSHGHARQMTAVCREIATQHGCDVIASFGSEVTVRVGYPAATERPAAVALLVAFAILERARRAKIAVRATIASGVAVADASQGISAAGALLAGLEPIRVVGPIAGSPAELLLDERTAELLREEVELEATGRTQVSGEELPLFLVRHLHAANLARLSNVEPLFVGRDFELIRLRDAWKRAGEGSGQIALVSGEPGIGKTGLVEEFVRRATLPQERIFAVRCSPHHLNTPFYPLMMLLREILGVELDTPPLKIMQMIEVFLERTEVSVTDHLPLLASFMTVTQPGGDLPELQLSGERRREGTIEAVEFMVRSAARKEPALLWVDDLQWADPSTKAALNRLISGLADYRLMIVLCSRNAELEGLYGLDRAQRLPLEPMADHVCARLLSQISEWGFLPAGLIRQIAARSDGVPLYLREIVRMVMAADEVGRDGIDAGSIPDSLRGLLATRLEACGPARPVVEWGAAIGKSFSRGLVLLVSELPEDELDAALERLVAMGILRAGAGGDDIEYSFSHALMRDAAYESMLIHSRRERHLKIAETLGEHFPQVAKLEPERVAIHYAASTRPDRAAEYWQAAGEASIETHAMVEAQSLFKQALDAARAAPKSNDSGELIEEIEALLAAL